jgi:hypothetical protein
MGEADPITRPSLYKIAHGRRFAPAEAACLKHRGHQSENFRPVAIVRREVGRIHRSACSVDATTGQSCAA